MPSLFDPYDLGPFHLKNRLVMAPMERSRARNPGWVPEADTARYSSQRAGAGLIVTGSIAIFKVTSHIKNNNYESGHCTYYNCINKRL